MIILETNLEIIEMFLLRNLVVMYGNKLRNITPKKIMFTRIDIKYKKSDDKFLRNIKLS